MRTILLSLFFCSSCCFALDSLTFPDACTSGNSIIIAAAGDVLLHQPLQEQASQKGFQSLWSAIIPFIQSADIAYANLEGPIAKGITENGNKVTGDKWDFNVYTSFPAFNYHPALASALKNSGFAIVSTANNHALDRFSIGVDKTIDALDDVGLKYVGTRKRNSDADRVVITQIKNFKIAWIACTETLNDNVDKYHQVLRCYGRKDRQWILETIENLKQQTDAIIILPHWGEEYHRKPNEEQMVFAHQVLNAGALAVLGSHPHVLQPLQKYVTKDGRNTLIMYSLGNFVSYQNVPSTRSSVILFLGLTKTPQGAIINGVRFLPTYMQNHGGLHRIELESLESLNNDSFAYDIISHSLPMENAIYTNNIITNPECVSARK